MLEEIEFCEKRVRIKQAWLAMRGILIRNILTAAKDFVLVIGSEEVAVNEGGGTSRWENECALKSLADLRKLDK